ncbi:hypothetical protein T265_04630 [Opisthorchis viverrini]|uniref:Uncharacterized protein n=1 Tax=Opisthorchis viverrini TaxID=6198 RepID=A0A074ZRX9_OPIVI|nr:hypothetical protein T265_04630 [Opisthorchis viverrini]KER28587.1 hypothetical protein T265_04630 [Opisthorchis viverrini]
MGGLVQHFQLPGDITNERFSWVPDRLTIESKTLVVDQMAVDLFAELGNWLANVSSPHEKTSSVRSWRTDQQPSDQQPINSPELPIFHHITECKTVVWATG